MRAIRSSALCARDIDVAVCTDKHTQPTVPSLLLPFYGQHGMPGTIPVQLSMADHRLFMAVRKHGDQGAQENAPRAGLLQARACIHIRLQANAALLMHK